MGVNLIDVGPFLREGGQHIASLLHQRTDSVRLLFYLTRLASAHFHRKPEDARLSIVRISSCLGNQNAATTTA